MTTAAATDNLLLAAPEVAIVAAGERKRPSISIVAYGGGVMRVPGWGDVAIELAGLEAEGQVPLLADHNASVSGVVGHGRAEVRDGRLLVTGVMSGTGEAARHIVDMTAGGFAFQASVGVEPVDHERVKGGEKVQVNGRTLASARGFALIKAGRLREVSITALGADAGTSVAIAASHGRKAMTTSTDVQTNEDQIRAEERERIKRIEAMCNGHWGQQEKQVGELRAAAIAGEIDEQDLGAKLLAILRASRPTISSHHPPVRSVDHAVRLEAALLSRMGMASLGEEALGPAAMQAGADLKATHALDLCRAALMYEGHEVPHGREAMVKAALSTTSLPTALGNLANKVLLNAYQESPATWRSFCSVRSVSDFKTNTAIRPSFATPLEQVAPGGELKHGTVGEWSKEYRVDTFGRMLSIDRRDLINDDLSVFDDTARALGRAAMRRLSDLVYDVLLANAGDFFSAANGNLLEGADSSLTFDGLAQAIRLMMVQRDEQGNDLDLRPSTLLVPPALQPKAKALLESEYLQQIAANAPTGNSLRRAVSLEVEPRLSNETKFGSAASDRRWYLFASPANVAMVVAFLQGQQAPTVEFFGIDHQVNRLAASWRVYHDFGTGLVDPRAAVHSKGE